MRQQFAQNLGLKVAESRVSGTDDFAETDRTHGGR
jgi:hypothetical protein